MGAKDSAIPRFQSVPLQGIQEYVPVKFIMKPIPCKRLNKNTLCCAFGIPVLGLSESDTFDKTNAPKTFPSILGVVGWLVGWVGDIVVPSHSLPSFLQKYYVFTIGYMSFFVGG